MNSTSFKDLDLIPQIQQALAAVEYTTPTPIQAQTIPHLLEGRDLLGTAQTGTGKTAAFALPILNRLGSFPKPSIPKAPQVLVLSPTRELAAQISESFRTYGRFLKFRLATVFGGVSQMHQVRTMARGAHVLVATPGRLLDLMNQGHIRLDKLEVFVLDEADRMLDMGFMPDVKKIIAKLPEKRHSLFFSATMPESVAELAEGLLKDPVRVAVAPEQPTVEAIEQQVLHVPQKEKGPLLCKLLDQPEIGRVLVFTRTKRGADGLAKVLFRTGYKAEAIHGNKSQNARTRTLQKFRDEHLRVLVATDLAARGLDVDGLTHVINYDLPMDAESYVHRIGRTGRAGAAGVALTFCDPNERSLLRAIERLIRRPIPVHAEHPDPHAGSERNGNSGRRPRRFGNGNGGGNRNRRGGPPRSRRFAKQTS